MSAPSLIAWRRRVEAIAIGVEAIATRTAVAIKVEAIANRVEVKAIAIRVEAIAMG